MQVLFDESSLQIYESCADLDLKGAELLSCSGDHHIYSDLVIIWNELSLDR